MSQKGSQRSGNYSAADLDTIYCWVAWLNVNSCRVVTLLNSQRENWISRKNFASMVYRNFNNFRLVINE